MDVKVRTIRSPPEDASLWKVAEESSSCPKTLKIMEAIKSGDDVKKLPHDHPGKALSNVWSEVSLEATSRGSICSGCRAQDLHTQGNKIRVIEGLACYTRMHREDVKDCARNLDVACFQE